MTLTIVILHRFVFVTQKIQHLLIWCRQQDKSNYSSTTKKYKGNVVRDNIAWIYMTDFWQTNLQV